MGIIKKNRPSKKIGPIPAIIRVEALLGVFSFLRELDAPSDGPFGFQKSFARTLYSLRRF